MVVDVTVLVLVKPDEPSGGGVEVASEGVDGTVSGIGEEVVGADEVVVEARDGGTCEEDKNEIS